jgi:deoxyribonuclease-4
MIGIQVNTLHELESLVKVTDILQIEVLQLFLKIPFEFSRKNFFHIQSIFATLKKTYSIKKIYIHAPDHLLLNGHNRKTRILQWKRIKEMLNQTSYLGGEGVIVHLQFKSNLNINELVEEAESVFWDQSPTIPLIFENVILPKTIGSDLSLMSEFLKGMLEGLRCEICLDTAHLYQTGFRFQDKEEALDLKTAYPFLFQHTTVLHINDSKMPPNSHLDWHEHLGKGCIGLGSLGAFISLFDHQQAFIIETPKKRFDDFIKNTDILRRLVLGNIKTEGNE